MIHKSVDADILSNLLGRSSTDPSVDDALQRFGVARRPVLRVDPDDADGPVVQSQDWVSNLSIGIEFGFQEEDAFRSIGEADQRMGPMILTEVYFYGDRPGAKPYPLPLPFGLLLSDSRTVVRGKMASLEQTRRSYVRDTWECAAFRMTVSYADEGRRIDFVVCLLRPKAPEAVLRGTARVPRILDIIPLLGKSMEDTALRQAFVPLGLDRQTLNTTTPQTIDLRRTYGLTLGLRKSPTASGVAAKSLLLQKVEFLRAGESESCGWPGDLPFGLRFDDSPETAIGKVGQTPSHQEDQDFYGHAFWALHDYSLQIFYSTMENLLHRVCVFASNV